MVFSLVSVLLTGLPNISAPLGHMAGVVGAPESTGPSSIGFQPQSQCEAKSVGLFKAVGGALRAVEQFQSWLDAAPGQEARLFGKKKGVLTALFANVGKGDRSALRLKQLAATPPKTAPGPGGAWVPEEPGRGEGDFWFFTKGNPVATVVVARGENDPCLPQIAVMLFDAKRAARVRLEARWGGAMTASLLGDGCAAVDFAFDDQQQAFVPTVVSRCAK